ncbi:MAG: two pore domain potassium channel family protein [Bacilli bacterium]|nr:two pore domain potassium channel family protein [Bacilli bacterium]
MNIKKLNKKVNKSIIISIIVIAIAIATMIMAYLNIGYINALEENITNQVKIYTIVVYGCVAFLQAVFYIKNFKKPGAFRFILFAIVSVACSAIVAIFNDYPWAYIVASILFFGVAILGRLISIVKVRTPRNILINILLLVIFGAILVASLTRLNEPNKLFSTTMVCATVVVITMCYILIESFQRIRLHNISEIIKRTYVFEILLGLLSLIVSFSFIFTLFEDISFQDALWYCFAVVTTIGFGDVTVKTMICRIMSVVLGMYGLIVVAVITSVIVNYYNESKNIDKQIKK